MTNFYEFFASGIFHSTRFAGASPRRLMASARAGRGSIFEVGQFLALNLYEPGKFVADGRRVAVNDVVTRYNDIVEEVETDPSLKIECRG